ncbi:MAG: MFS transporter [Parahaliea sp.]
MTAKSPQARRALFFATIAFAVNFSIWTLYAVMAIELKNTLGLSATHFGLLLSAPILTGTLLRLPIGLLCERYSSRNLFIGQMLLVIPALLALSRADSYKDYLLLGLAFGISGASFTIGISYITDWFRRDGQGTAMGIFGAGNAGAALTFICVPFIIHTWGWQAIGPVYALVIGLTVFLFALFTPRLPAHLAQHKQQQSMRDILTPLLQGKVWRFGLYYYFVFGSFLALLLWLPQYFVQAYSLPMHQAMALTLLFVSTSSIARAIGGWFSDRYGGRAVNWSVFWICLVCLFFLSYPPTTMTIHGAYRDVDLSIALNLWIFLTLLLIVGIAQGFGRASVYKIINDYYPNQMGSVGGMVAMLGALGGCTLPVMFGALIDLAGIYSACFMLLYAVLAGCMILMHLAIRHERYQNRLHHAIENNFLHQDRD